MPETRFARILIALRQLQDSVLPVVGLRSLPAALESSVHKFERHLVVAEFVVRGRQLRVFRPGPVFVGRQFSCADELEWIEAGCASVGDREIARAVRAELSFENVHVSAGCPGRDPQTFADLVRGQAHG